VARLKSLIALKSFKLGISQPAREVLDTIYQAHVTVNDPRFASYETRRHDHLLKLCAVLCSLSDSDKSLKTVTKEHVLAANTLLYYAERKMPLALGEFGKGKFADISNAVMETLHRSRVPLSLTELWKVVAQDLNGQNDLVAILRGLQTLEKIQTVEVNSQVKFLPVKGVVDYFDDSLLLKGFLTKEEEVLGGII